MKLSDFDFTPNDVDCWARGSCSNKLARGKRKATNVFYRVKIHDAPVWKKAKETNAKKEQELKQIEKELKIAKSKNDMTAEAVLERKQKTLIATIKNCTPEKIKAAQKNDNLCDEYVEYKNALTKKIRSSTAFINRIYCPDEMWMEFLPIWSDTYRSVEAARECQECIPFAFDKPNNFTTLQPKEQYRIFSTFAECYEYLHSIGVIHSDIKMHNMIIGNDASGNPTGFVIDFDAAYLENDIRFSNPHVRDNLFGGTLMSPEHSALFREKDEGASVATTQISGKTDVFSFAVAMYECLCGQEYSFIEKLKYVIPDGEPMEMYELINNTFDPPNGKFILPDSLVENHPYFSALFSWMVEYSPNDRPTMTQVKTALLEYEAYMTTGNSATSIPQKYLPINKKAPWDETMEFDLSADPKIVSIEKSLEKGDPWYVVQMASGVKMFKHDKDLRVKGLIRKAGSAKPVTTDKIQLDTPWDTDDIEFLPVSDVKITKNTYPGAGPGNYIVVKQGVSLRRTAAALIQEGYAKKKGSTDSIYDPWPEDNITLTKLGISKRVKRNVAKGPGHYLSSSNNEISVSYLTFYSFATKNDVEGVSDGQTWPSDKIRLISKPNVTITRAPGVGYYIVRCVGASSVLRTAKDLIRLGLAETI